MKKSEENEMNRQEYPDTKKKSTDLLRFGTALLIVVMGLFLGACSKNTAESSLAVYNKADGLYYLDLSNKSEQNAEQKIYEEKGLYPLISDSGNYIAYSADDGIYVYDLKSKTSEKLGDKKEHYYISYDWMEDSLVYSMEEPGFTIYNPVTKEKKVQEDELYYDNFRWENHDFLYAKRTKKWTTSEGSFMDTGAIVQIQPGGYNDEEHSFPMEVVIEGKETTGDTIGYNPVIWAVQKGKVYIMEKPASGSLSTDGVGIGVYDQASGTHQVFDNITTLPYGDNLAIHPADANRFAVIEGAGREMIWDKELVMVNIGQDENSPINFMGKNWVAMTPAFSKDGKTLLYSASKKAADTDFNQSFDAWEKLPHNIYQVDLDTLQVEALTQGDAFDFMPISRDKGFLFLRKVGQSVQLMEQVEGKESVLAENIMLDGDDSAGIGFYGHIETSKGLDLLIQN